MITSFSVENYRGFRSPLKIDGLRRVNLIAGENNVGKTSLLEAVVLLLDPSGDALRTLAATRGIEASFNLDSELQRWLFSDGQTSRSILLGASFDHPPRGAEGAGLHGSTTIRLVEKSALSAADPEEYQTLAAGVFGNDWKEAIVGVYRDEQGTFERWFTIPTKGGIYSRKPHRLLEYRVITSNSFAPDLAADFSQVQISRSLEPYIPALRHVEPRLKQLQLLTMGGQPELFGDIGAGPLLPLSFMGEGLRRLLAMVLGIIRCPGGIVLVDEFENGLHHSAIEGVWRALGEAAKVADCQIIATTHSYECIQAAQIAFADNGEDDLTFIRLERHEDSIVPVVVDEEILETAIGHDWEVR